MVESSGCSQRFQRFSHIPPTLEQIRATQKIIKQLFPLLRQVQWRFRIARILYFLYIASSNQNDSSMKKSLNSALTKPRPQIFKIEANIPQLDFAGVYTRSQLGHVVEIMNKTQPLLECLQQELSKIDIPTDYAENVDSIVSFADFTSNGIVTEGHDEAYETYYMQSKIKSSLKDVKKIRCSLKILQKKLAELVTQY